MNLLAHKYIRICLFNLMIVALLGVILRYKIAFSLSIVDQKHLLHAHSHFAFAGWLSQLIMTLMVAYISKEAPFSKKYKWLLIANLITAYGMLLSFPFEGYGVVSITFSTLSIFVSYAFAIIFWRDLNKTKGNKIVNVCFKAALVFNAVSSLGAFSLAAMMATKTIHQNWYLAVVYFFLHFQYNGWFFFGCLGLLFNKLVERGVYQASLQRVYRLFVWACVPAYLLSVLWLEVSVKLYVLIVAAALAQLVAAYLLIKILLKEQFTNAFNKAGKWLLILSVFAFSIKILLQTGSVIPSLSTWAFGFRPIVIGYLHLVLLGMITLFLIGYLLSYKLIPIKRMLITGVFVFTAGVIFNEFLLMLQGVTALKYYNIQQINYWLLAAAVIMLCGIAIITITSKNKIIFKNIKPINDGTGRKNISVIGDQ
ncbi:hypothetical protein BH09BAC2_BH09BAC2_04380 [soil metagenome]